MIERLIHRAALSLALAGGAALLAITALTVISVTGRGLIAVGLGPVPGDSELVEMAAAFAIFSFLPWCQLQRGHVTVDLFMAPLGRRANLTADLIGNGLKGDVEQEAEQDNGTHHVQGDHAGFEARANHLSAEPALKYDEQYGRE